MAASKFNRPKPTAGKGAAPAKRKSKYAGISAAVPRDPMPVVGQYRFRTLECNEGFNPGTGTESFKTQLEIVEIFKGGDGHEVGDTVCVIHLISGKAGPSGLARVKAQVMASAGFEDEESYDEYDPDGEYIDAQTGADNDMSDKPGIVGRLVDCDVTRGNPVGDTGDYYREYAWAPVSDDEQE